MAKTFKTASSAQTLADGLQHYRRVHVIPANELNKTSEMPAELLNMTVRQLLKVLRRNRVQLCLVGKRC